MKNIAIIGECLLEFYEDKSNLFKQGFAGDTFNCAVYLKRSLEQSNVEYITIVGKDDLSNKMLDFFKEHDINTNYIHQIKDKNLGLYIIKTKNGERSFTYYRSDSAAKKLFQKQYLKQIKQDINKFDLIYFSAITLAIMSKNARDNFFDIISSARKKGVIIAYDSNYRPKLYKNIKKAINLYNLALKHCDIFLPSIDDEKELLGDIKAKHIIKKAKQANVKEIIIKAGKNSVIYHSNNKTKKIKIKSLKNIVDSTSAGDSFNGGYLASRLNNKSIKESIIYGSKLASKVIMYKGAIIPKDKYE